MDKQVPLGKRESNVLEFKAAAALRNPFSISREVVAMLNSEGGEIWVGLQETDGMATKIENIPNIERVRVDLWNHLLEVVEPRLRSEDVTIENKREDGCDFLLLTVKRPEARGPYAQLKNGGRNFVTRVDHRIRPMTHEEVFAKEAPADRGGSTGFLSKGRTKALKEDRAGLWVGIAPAPPLEIDVQKKELAAYFQNPTKSGNRLTGWSFLYYQALSLGIEPRLKDRRIEYGKDDYRKVTVWDNGCVEFWVSMNGLHHRTDSVPEIYPLALLEYAVSISRLAASLFQDPQVANPEPKLEEVFVDTALIKADGWHLPAYPPSTFGYQSALDTPEELEDGRVLLQSPLRFSWEEFQQFPDQAGYLLVRSIYQAFHLREDRIPREYDRENKILLIKE